ncbi:MAG: type II toxin-antitoxin system RelB/DinJ family antitoxin [Clostridiales bacterium]|jgi:DNA-damage-inducible protein J|nr:type II toxin-antitoxin system RelB/DinJ family antitoxin [Clostridiales bacterium]
MAKTSTITIRTDAETKAEIEYLYGRFGLTVSDAVNIFFSKSLMEHGLPFDMTIPYNQETLDALQEADDIISGKVQAKAYTSLEEMHADIDALYDDDEDGDA